MECCYAKLGTGQPASLSRYIWHGRQKEKQLMIGKRGTGTIKWAKGHCNWAATKYSTWKRGISAHFVAIHFLSIFKIYTTSQQIIFRRVFKIARSDYTLRNVRLSVRMERIGSHWTDFHEIWYLRLGRKYVEKAQVSLKSDKNNGYFTWTQTYIYDNISLSYS